MSTPEWPEPDGHWGWVDKLNIRSVPRRQQWAYCVYYVPRADAGDA